MNAQSLSRRGVVAALATLPVAASAVAAPITPDPIFTAIEMHRAALLARFDAEIPQCELPYLSPEYEAVEVQFQAAYARQEVAATALIKTVPLTAAGALAALQYADDLYAQKVRHPTLGREWHSNHASLGEFSDDEVLDAYNGEPIDLPLIFWIARNARETLQHLI